MKIGIVGSGIIGSYLGWKLGKDNEIIIFEKKKGPGKEVCSGLISERIWEFIPKNERLVEHTIRYCNIHFGRRIIKLKFNPNMLVFNRLVLDRYVSKLAEECADMKYNNEVERVFYIEDNKPIILANGKHYEFDYIIGADGAVSIVRKSLFLPNPDFRLGIQGFIKKKNHSDIVDIYKTNNGFFWKIPRGEYMEYGIIEDIECAKNIFDYYAKRNGLCKIDLYSAVIPSGLVLTGLERITLCGDACGITKPWSGGGVLWGLHCADYLINCFPDFKKYEKNIARFYKSKTKLFKFKMNFFNKFNCIFPREINFDADWGI